MEKSGFLIQMDGWLEMYGQYQLCLEKDSKMKELLIRAIYVEMLGHDASFSHIHAINLT